MEESESKDAIIVFSMIALQETQNMFSWTFLRRFDIHMEAEATVAPHPQIVPL